MRRVQSFADAIPDVYVVHIEALTILSGQAPREDPSDIFRLGDASKIKTPLLRWRFYFSCCP
jgi:hypothetical protein